jgi:UDP-N-acetyl-D-glucosamine dehydrogenase
LAGEVNTAMPQRVVDRTIEALNERAARAPKGSRILVVGVAYKKNVDDTRESPAFRIMELLEKRGASVSFHDPMVAEIPPTREHATLAGRHSVLLTQEVVSKFDAALICTDHDGVDYRGLIDWSRLVIDTRNVCARYGLWGDNIVKA